jgi:formate hydrogenlyase subunit 6/NADH:ubiquinone oxidoreductase subunit I
VPRCVDQCPTDALRFGEEEEFADFIKDAELLNPAAGTKSRVYYKHLPKKFVAGTVYDPVEKEVIIGAQVHAEGHRPRARPIRANGQFRRLLVPGPRR